MRRSRTESDSIEATWLRKMSAQVSIRRFILADGLLLVNCMSEFGIRIRKTARLTPQPAQSANPALKHTPDEPSPTRFLIDPAACVFRHVIAPITYFTLAIEFISLFSRVSISSDILNPISAGDSHEPFVAKQLLCVLLKVPQGRFEFGS